MTFTLSSPPDTNFLRAFPSLEALKTSINQSINKQINQIISHTANKPVTQSPFNPLHPNISI